MSQEAIEALNSFLKEEGFRAETDEAKRDLAQLSMTATFQVGQILQGQQKFAEAIAAWKGYLAKYPNGPQSADAQRAILDTQLLIAADHAQREQYAEARAAWQTFVAQNPLDGRVPQLLFEIGESFQTEKKYDEAIAAWGPLISKFPQSEPAAHAQFPIASIFENEKGDPGRRHRAVQEDRQSSPGKAQAAQRVAVMESKALTVVTPRTFRSGETAHLKITTRNLEKLTFTAYKLNAEAYFRKKHVLAERRVARHRPGAARRRVDGRRRRLRQVQARREGLRRSRSSRCPACTSCKVTDEKTLQATTLVRRQRPRRDREDLARTGPRLRPGHEDGPRPRRGAGARRRRRRRSILEAKTGRGRRAALRRGTSLATPNSAPAATWCSTAATSAGSGLGVPDKVAQGLTPRAYIYTDRPAYRPGQKVALRGVVREVRDGQYANIPAADYRLEVDRQPRPADRRAARDALGVRHLPRDRCRSTRAPRSGTYRVRRLPARQERVRRRVRGPVVSARKDRPGLRPQEDGLLPRRDGRGRRRRASTSTAHRSPNRPIAVRLARRPHRSTARPTLDGKYHVEFPTEGFAEEQVLATASRSCRKTTSRPRRASCWPSVRSGST